MKKLNVSISIIVAFLLGLLLISCSSDDGENLKKQKELRKGYKKMNLYAYDKDADEISKIIQIPTESYEFDENGNITYAIQIDRKSGKSFMTGYKYNNANLFKSIVRLNVDGEVEYTELREYQEGDTIMAKKIFYVCETPGKIETADRYEFIYDNKGEIIDMTNKGKHLIEGTKYGETFYESDIYPYIESGKVKYKYDDKGLVIEKTMLNDNKKPIITFKFEYQ